VNPALFRRGSFCVLVDGVETAVAHKDTQAEPAPKVFISYAHESDEHAEACMVPKFDASP
jgi:hypothetical protein